MQENNYMNGAILSLLRSLEEFNNAYYELKEIAEDENPYIDGLKIYAEIEEEPIYLDDINTDYVQINNDYALVLTAEGSSKAYIQAIYVED